MNKYQLTVQHDFQKVAYIEFQAESDDAAKIQAEKILSNYKNQPFFSPVYPMSGNFTGQKPRITNTWVAKWIYSAIATNAWGGSSGGYWSDLS